MAAVIGIEPKKIEKALRDASLDSIDIANYNSPSQTVISGPKDDIPAAQKALEQAGARMIIPLKVSGAFHSRYMKEAMNEFSKCIDACEFHQLSFTVISNVTGAPYDNAGIGDNLKKQMISPVRWTESIQFLKKLPSPVFEEIGPGNVLTKLVKQIS
jgi:malonyl CoA-acyl carrier protein transacylase